MSHVILGRGEVGSAYGKWLELRGHSVFYDDIDKSKASKGSAGKVDALHVCIRYSDAFHDAVRAAIRKHNPAVVNVMSTVVPGTCEKLRVSHSTTRGLHPNLFEAIGVIPKHYGGPQAEQIAAIFDDFRAKDSGRIHRDARTTELIHIASNFQYAVNVMAADEIERWCRAFNVDYIDFMAYSKSHNEGYQALGLHSKVRPIVWPSGGAIGGHCIKLAKELIPSELHGPLTKHLAQYK